MTGEREGLADLLAEHDYRWSSGGAICLCGFVPTVDPSTLWTQQDYHRHHLADLLAARDRRVRGEAVWQVSAFGRGRSVDRICDSLTTGQSVCDDLMEQLGGEWSVVEDWANLNVTEAPERWVRYVSRNGGDPVEQIVAAMLVDTSGTWFREREAE